MRRISMATTKKVQLIKEIEKTVPPCQYTLEELNARLDKAEEEARNGQYITHEEMKQKFLEWK